MSPDINALRERAKAQLTQCGPHDYGLTDMGCGCPSGDSRPVISSLLAELDRMTAEAEKASEDRDELRAERDRFKAWNQEARTMLAGDQARIAGMQAKLRGAGDLIGKQRGEMRVVTSQRDEALATVRGLVGEDLSAHPGQPDGIEDDSRDMPNPLKAGERILAYVSNMGDGLYHAAAGQPLYGRDLESVVRAFERLRAECVQLDEANTWLGRALTEARAELARYAERLDRLRTQAQHLNQPMVARLRQCAADTSTRWDGQVTVYPPEARELVALIDACRVDGGDSSRETGTLDPNAPPIEAVLHALGDVIAPDEPTGRTRCPLCKTLPIGHERRGL